MRSTLLTLLFILFSHQVLAQQQSGGLPDVEERPKGMNDHEYELMSKQYKVLLKEVNQQWVKCGNQSIKQFEDLYTQLKWLDGESKNKEKDQSCESANAKVLCFYTPKIKVSLRDFFGKDKVESFLNYEEDEHYAKSVCDYFRIKSAEDQTK